MLLFFFFSSLFILHSHNIFSTINASLHPFNPFIYLFSSFLPCFSIFFLFPFHLSEQVCIKETNTSTYQLPPSPPLSSSLPFFFLSLFLSPSLFPSLFHSLPEGIVHLYAISTNPTWPFGGRSGYRRLHGSRQGRVSLE